MKSRFVLIVLLFVFGRASGQATSLYVLNNTSCPVYFELIFSNTTPVCSTTSATNTTVIMFPANTSTIYDFTTNQPPGYGGGATYFIGTTVLDGPPGCFVSGMKIGEPCLFPDQVYYFTQLTGTCSVCASSSATWYPSTPSDPMARLEFF